MSDDSSVMKPQTSDTPDRVFTDAEGRRWTVREMPTPLDRRSGPSLVFETDEIMRRVRTFPANWLDLTDEELYVLSLGR